MRRALVAAAAAGAAFTMTVAAETSSPETVPVTVEPGELFPGAPLRVTVNAPPDSDVTGTFLGRELVFVESIGGGHVSFAGIDLDVDPGPVTLAVEWTDAAGGHAAHAVELTVEPRDYPTERLQVESKYVEPPPDVSARIASEAELLKSIWARSSPERLFDGKTVRPLEGVAGRNFGRRRVFNDQPRSPHSGADLSAATGTPVEAAAAGRVVLARDLYFSGNLVVIDHGAGVYTLYAHLSRMHVSEGDALEAGVILGEVGATGRVTGPHLHWGARIGEARVEPHALLALLR